ncbi:MAG: hypothetical protein AAGF53_08450 [Pseudomonadota bacterium]
MCRHSLNLTGSAIENINNGLEVYASGAGVLDITVILDDNDFNDLSNNLITLGVEQSTVLTAWFTNNIINETDSNDITVPSNGSSPALRPSAAVLIDNNIIIRFNLFGIEANAAGGTASHEATIANNVVNTPGQFSAHGIRAQSGWGIADGTNLFCLKVSSNDVTNLALDESVQLEQFACTTLQLQGFTRDGTSKTGVEASPTANNILNHDTNVRTAGRIVDFKAGTCLTL